MNNIPRECRSCLAKKHHACVRFDPTFPSCKDLPNQELSIVSTTYTKVLHSWHCWRLKSDCMARSISEASGISHSLPAVISFNGPSVGAGIEQGLSHRQFILELHLCTKYEWTFICGLKRFMLSPCVVQKPKATASSLQALQARSFGLQEGLGAG